MESVRQQKVSRFIQKELGDLFLKEGASIWGQQVLVTVTQVRITPDLQIARVYLSIFGTQDKKRILSKISENAGEIRYKFGKLVRHQLKAIPALEFFEDDSLDYIENIDDLLKS